MTTYPLEWPYEAPLVPEDVGSGLDQRLRPAAKVALAMLWVLLLVNSWQSFYPFTECAYILLVIVAVLLDARCVPVVLLIGFFAPMELRIPRPYMVTYGLLLFLGFTKGNLEQRMRSAQHKIVLLAAIYTTYCFLPLPLGMAENVAVSFRFTMNNVESLAFLVLFLAFLDSRDTVGIILRAAGVLAGLALVISLLHYFYRSQMWLTDIALYQAKTGNYLAETKYALMKGTIVVGERIMWAGHEPNYWGATLQFPFWVVIGLVVASRQFVSRVMWIILGSMILFGVLGTFSRGSFVSLLATGLVFLARYRWRAAIPVILLVAVGMAAFYAVPLLSERFLGVGESLATTGGSGRLQLWGMGLRMWLTSPLYGHGLGSCMAMYGTIVHNTYIQLLAETGVLGFGLSIAIIIAGLAAWTRVVRHAKLIGDTRMRWLGEGGLLGTIGVCINLNTISLQKAMYLWMPVAIGVALWSHIRREDAADQESAWPETVP